MVYVMYLQDGSLVGVTNETPQPLPGVSYHELTEAPDLSTMRWDVDQMMFVRDSTVMSKKEFLARFTMNERIAIRDSADPIVRDLMFMLEAAAYVDVVDPLVVQGINYLAAVNLIAASRVQEILD